MMNTPTPAKSGPYVIAIANQKGGVAKTTTVVSLAGALTQFDQEVLVIDLDAQANLTLALGVNPAQVTASIADVLMKSAPLSGASRETAIPGLDLVPANAEMNLAERFLPLRSGYQTLLKTAIAAQSCYDWVLLDCPPAMGAVTTNALAAADLLLIPTQPEYFSVYALKTMMGAINTIRAEVNPSLAYRVVLTMQDKRNRIHRDLSEQTRATFGDAICQTVIETDTKLRESAVAGLPITHYIAQTRSSRQYRALAEELIQHVEETAKKTAG
jgi:chromosome partitioning protein